MGESGEFGGLNPTSLCNSGLKEALGMGHKGGEEGDEGWRNCKRTKPTFIWLKVVKGVEMAT